MAPLPKCTLWGGGQPLPALAPPALITSSLNQSESPAGPWGSRGPGHLSLPLHVLLPRPGALIPPSRPPIQHLPLLPLSSDLPGTGPQTLRGSPRSLSWGEAGRTNSRPPGWVGAWPCLSVSGTFLPSPPPSPAQAFLCLQPSLPPPFSWNSEARSGALWRAAVFMRIGEMQM